MKLPTVMFVTAFILPGALAIAEPTVLFEESFDKQLGEGWSWLRESPDDWRLNDGALEILVQPGKANSVKNALVRPAPDRASTRYAVEVTVEFTKDLSNQYEQAGITWYQDQKPVFKFVHEFVDGKALIVPGFKTAPSKKVQLRLVVEGRRWTAQFRENLQAEFQSAASGELPPPGNDSISLQCYDGPPNSEHWVRFDDFRIVELPQ